MEELLPLIPVGQENRITSNTLTKLTGFQGTTIRAIIHQLRLDGYPICSDSFGYWMSTTPEELNRTIAQLNSRIHHLVAVKEALKKTQQIMTENEKCLHQNNFLEEKYDG